MADEVFPRIEKQLARPGWFEPVTVRLGGLVVFPGRRSVLARLVVPSVELLELQERVFAMMRPCPGSASHTAPGTWTPHVTLARRLFPDQVGGAVRVLERIRDRTGSGVAVRRWDGGAHTAWAVGDTTDPGPGSRDCGGPDSE
ncbi:2'-5' RNA ligase family protein [Rhodococcus sp. D2-41]|nr:2'-5' RNA ligase family protein [Rhodococcus sp. D2-41]